MTQESLPAKLKLLRARAGLTLIDAAAKTGVGRDTLSDIERGHRRPVMPTLAKLAEGYGVDVSELLVEEPVAAGKASAPVAGTGAESDGSFELADLMYELNTPSMNLLDPELKTVLEGASDDSAMRIVDDVNRELDVLLPAFERLLKKLRPQDPKYMDVFNALEWTNHQALAVRNHLRSRLELRSQEEVSAFWDRSGQVLQLEVSS